MAYYLRKMCIAENRQSNMEAQQPSCVRGIASCLVESFNVSFQGLCTPEGTWVVQSLIDP